ncbi:uncharacterized protein LOC129719918 [Wyeomyia smithii]|uniref:uncharacterized protein LOC129719918 n=1 Tax=Wyeomyia smithii TaxID=174621 RepID=UPI002467D197|nr:uncharacterized protein LOC129719918 [Wyeomyia smithii]
MINTGPYEEHKFKNGKPRDPLNAMTEEASAVRQKVAHLLGEDKLEQLVGKLPADQKLMWAGFKRDRVGVDLKTFSEYMTGVMQDASSVVLYESDARKTSGREKTKAYVNSHQTKGIDTSTPPVMQYRGSGCLHCDKEGHKLRECQAFRALSIDDCWRRIRALSVCQICLYAHGRRACRSNNRCNVNGCQFKHHPLLHGKSTAPPAQVANNHTHRLLDSDVLSRILPVTLYGKSGKVNTFAFLDKGSSLTLVEGDLVAQLGLEEEPQPLCLRWTGNTSRVEKESHAVTVAIPGSEQQRQYKLVNARIVHNLDLPSQSFDFEEAANKFAYLRQLPIKGYRYARPAILIGIDNLKLAVPLKTREGDGSGPIAVKTRLGWCVSGRRTFETNQGFSFHICGCARDDSLHETVKHFFAVEENGVGQYDSKLSAEEKRAQELLEQTTKRVGRHFEAGLLWNGFAFLLLWKEDDIELPDSYGMALRRHQCLQRRMERDPVLWENISRQIKEYVQKGFAQRATTADLESADPRNSQRFLWSNTPGEAADIYVMNVATFGGTCSPASAQYVKNINAMQHIQRYPRAVEGILKCHFVNDYLDSFGSESEAKKVSSEVRLVHSNGGFHLRNWRSNSERVLIELGESAAADIKNLYLDRSEHVNRVLGMLWSTGLDELSFFTRMSEEVRHLLDSGTRPTKRQVLRCVMSLFDPLGLLAPFIIHSKVLIQELWRAGTEWDEAIGDKAFEHWNRWTKMIEFISTVKIPRCYFPRATEATYKSAQLHVFVDASEIAYSCAAYIRTTANDGSSECVLVSGKTKVAPLKPMSIPRTTIPSRSPKDFFGLIPQQREHGSNLIRTDTSHLWPIGWERWVPSKLNPADEATKWGRGPYFNQESQWFNGLAFLRLPEEEWPKTTEPTEPTTEEVRPSVLLHFVFVPVLDYNRFSSWRKMVRTAAYALRCLFNYFEQTQKINGPLTQGELLGVEHAIVRLVQRESYPDEMAILEQNRTKPNHKHAFLERKSALFKLMPELDETGLLRQLSRIIAANAAIYDARFSLILPSKHRAIRKACPGNPPMAALPSARLAVHMRPFTYVGLDYFGPFLTKVGRSNVKRWIALFTCLTVRAVHLEIAFSLTTASCISCVRRFIGRQGSPIEIFNDNGTNFQGAERILCDQIDQELSVTVTSTTRNGVSYHRGHHIWGCLGKECATHSIKHCLISCRVTQSYDAGACVYFYFGFNHTGFSSPVHIYETIEAHARDEILACGGSISHHHGVGKIRSRWYPQTVSEVGVALYRATKRQLDPKNIFAAGNFLPLEETEKNVCESQKLISKL